MFLQLVLVADMLALCLYSLMHSDILQVTTNSSCIFWRVLLFVVVVGGGGRGSNEIFKSWLSF